MQPMINTEDDYYNNKKKRSDYMWFKLQKGKTLGWFLNFPRGVPTRPNSNY